MSNILKLKKANKASSLAKLKEQAESYNTKTNYKDDRYWQPVVDKNNTGSAIIRFLSGTPIPETNDFEPDLVRKWSHGFKGPTGLWYIENSLTTLDNARDPCTEYNSKLWKTGDPEDREQARRQKRKLSYTSNILVVKHPGRPEDEGKVFLYKYGQKIYDKIMEKVDPKPDELDPNNIPEALNIFDYEDGANFRLKIKNVASFRNYDESSFDAPRAISKDESELALIQSKQYSLLDEIAPDKFKSYQELQTRLFEVLDLDKDDAEDRPRRSEAPRRATATATTTITESDDDEPPFDVDEDGVVTDKPSTSSSEFFRKLKTAKV